MIKTLVNAVLILLVLVAAGFFVFGYWARAPREAAGVLPPIDSNGARERAAEVGKRAAEVGERAVQAAAAVDESVEEGRLTATIKAKMILDDFVKARVIDVTTRDSTVTLTGTVNSQRERDRAVQLARETEGVTRVTDGLVIQQP